MSLYDIAVKKLGFPTIELFVKVSNVVNFCKSSPTYTHISHCHCQYLLIDYSYSMATKVWLRVSKLTQSLWLFLYVYRLEVMGRALVTVHSLRDCL